LKINRRKLEIILAKQCKTATDLREYFSPQTITRMRKGYNVSTKTVGKIAKALDVDVMELIESE